MGDARHHDAPRLEWPEMDVTEKWRADANAALKVNKLANEKAGLKPRAKDRLPDDHASLGRAIHIKTKKDYSAIRTLLGAAKPGSQRPAKMVSRSSFVLPISRVLKIDLPTSDDELMAAAANVNPSYREMLRRAMNYPDFEQFLVTWLRSKEGK